MDDVSGENEPSPLNGPDIACDANLLGANRYFAEVSQPEKKESSDGQFMFTELLRALRCMFVQDTKQLASESFCRWRKYATDT